MLSNEGVKKIFFDVQEQYYLPQYIPLAEKLLANKGVEVAFVVYSKSILLPKDYKVIYVSNIDDRISVYNEHKPNWLIIGNTFSNIQDLDKAISTALVSHGIGPKSCYYTVSDTPTTVRFVEGPYRLERLKTMYPDQNFVDTGYAKLDPIVNGQYENLKPSSYGLDDKKPTILYAPAFFPSSIECFSQKFPEEFSKYNIMLKPHYFSMTSPKYKAQRKILEYWAQKPNVYLARREENNLVPFMAIADVLISDASSALFEFAALDKPVVWCDFMKLRWSYKGPFKYRFNKRMDKDLYQYSDIAKHVDSYLNLKATVDSQLENPNEYSEARKKYTLNLAGIVDGKASQRIADYLLQNCSSQ